MSSAAESLQERYAFADFAFYTGLLLVPLLTAFLAVHRHSTWAAAAYVLAAAVVAALLMRFLCTRCPHYRRDEKLLYCIFFWGVPKLFPPRPGKLTTIDKLAIAGAGILLTLMPLPWLMREPGSLLIYLLSGTCLAAALYRRECPRCIYFACPVNRVPAAARRDRPEH